MAKHSNSVTSLNENNKHIAEIKIGIKIYDVDVELNRNRGKVKIDKRTEKCP